MTVRYRIAPRHPSVCRHLVILPLLYGSCVFWFKYISLQYQVLVADTMGKVGTRKVYKVGTLCRAKHSLTRIHVKGPILALWLIQGNPLKGPWGPATPHTDRTADAVSGVRWRRSSNRHSPRVQALHSCVEAFQLRPAVTLVVIAKNTVNRSS